MAANQHTRSVEELERRVEELQDRLEALESIFSERTLDREQGHTQAKKRDARTKLQPGETHQVVIDSPPGEGRDPNKAVGRVDGIVVFVDPQGTEIRENDVLKILIKDVEDNCAKANVLDKIRSPA